LICQPFKSILGKSAVFPASQTTLTATGNAATIPMNSVTPSFHNHPLIYRSCLVGLLWLALHPVSGLAWSAAVTADPLTLQERCLLRSDPQTSADGYGQTPVVIVLNGEALLVVTESQIDTSFGDIELAVDNKTALGKTRRVAKGKIAIFDQEVATIVNRFKTARSVTVWLRFWPTWPATQRFASRFTLKDFGKAYSEFERCRQPG
jgi:hypothetical protein